MLSCVAILFLADRGWFAALDDGAADANAGNVGAAGRLEHDVEHELFEKSTQRARAGAPLDRLFGDDRDDGSLDLLKLSDLPLELVVLAKAIGAWLATGLPVALASPRRSPISRVMTSCCS